MTACCYRKVSVEEDNDSEDENKKSHGVSIQPFFLMAAIMMF